MPGEFTTSLLGAKECFEKAALQKTFKKYIKKHKKGIKKLGREFSRDIDR